MPLGASRLNFLAKTAAGAAGRTALTLTANANAKISTAQSKFGGSSAYFDGTDDYIITEENDILIISGDFTWEGWVRPAASHSGRIMCNRIENADFFSVPNPYASIAEVRVYNNLLYFSLAGVSFTNTSISANTWTHFALVKSGSTVKGYKNGSSVGSTTHSTTLGDTRNKAIMLGAYKASNPQSEFSGYIDEVRVSDTARYTSNFTPPTAAFTNDADTVLLLHLDGANNSTTFTDDAS